MSINRHDWGEVRNNPEKLVELANELGLRGVADRFSEISSKETVRNALHRNDAEYDRRSGKWVYEEKSTTNFINDDNFVEFLQERVKNTSVDIEKNNDVYLIKEGSYEVELSVEQLKDIYSYYCELGLSAEKTARLVDKNPKDIKLAKRAFRFSHHSVPVPEEELLEKDIEDAIEEILAIKEKKLRDLKPIKELEYLRDIRDKYFEEHYQADRVISELSDLISSKEYDEPEIVIENYNDDMDMVVVLSDWHYGKLVLRNQIAGEDNEYNSQVFNKRINKYFNRIIEKINLYEPKKIHIVNLGDIADGPNADIYPGQEYSQDVRGELQLLNCASALKQFVWNIYDYHGSVDVIGLPGNHSTGEMNTDMLIVGMVSEWLEDTNIGFDIVKQPFKVVDIQNSSFIFNHGDNLRSGTNTRENDILNILHAYDLQDRSTYFISAHKHHESGEGVGYEHKQVPSLVGADDYARNRLNVSSRPAQMFFLVEGDRMTGRYKIYFD